PVSSIGGNDIYKVKSFREKPDITQGEKFIKDGKFFWNSGTFIWTVSTILDSIKNLLPDIYEGLLKIEYSLGTENEEDVIRRVYEDIKPVSIDYGVMERTDGALLVKGTFGWSDIGSWDALYDVLSKDEKGNSLRGPVIAIDSSNSLIHSPHKLVTLVGVENLIVVETEDSLLICNRGCSQDVKKVVDRLEEKEMKEYL
ncbi:MAG: mannose-1-phosphate guanylyltransferase, partial [Deltaproteobacteria bacterium]|nr:mannose-1-phosphate guanylyltransferase [Deltaproteobacteria bacterium]